MNTIRQKLNRLRGNVPSTTNQYPDDISRDRRSAENLIANASGEHGYDGWTVTENGGDGWSIEKEPIYCSPLPTKEFLGVDSSSSKTYCFAGSHGWCSKSYLVDLRKKLVGLAGQEFEIKCGQMYTVRGDCGGKFFWRLSLLDEKKRLVKKFEKSYELEQIEDQTVAWKEAEHTFKFQKYDGSTVKQIHYLEFIHKSMDNKCWSGHYGMKLARSTVVVVGPSITEMAYQQNTKDKPTTTGILQKNTSEDVTSKLPPGAAKLPLRICTLEGKQYKILAYTNWTVEILKQKFLEVRGQKDGHSCVLQYRARILANDTVLSFYRMEPDCVLQANFTKFSGEKEQSSCKKTSVETKVGKATLIGNCIVIMKGAEPIKIDGVKKGCLVLAKMDDSNITLGEVDMTCKINGLGDIIYVGIKFRKQLALGLSGIKILHSDDGGEGYCDKCQGRQHLFIPSDKIGNSKNHLFSVQ